MAEITIPIKINLDDKKLDEMVKKVLAENDFVEVVRCKDCGHMEIEESNAGRYCHVWGFYNGAGDEGFCNYGERREA